MLASTAGGRFGCVAPWKVSLCILPRDVRTEQLFAN